MLSYVTVISLFTVSLHSFPLPPCNVMLSFVMYHWWNTRRLVVLTITIFIQSLYTVTIIVRNGPVMILLSDDVIVVSELSELTRVC